MYSLASLGLLNADLEKSERAELEFLGLLPIHHVQDNRYSPGCCGDQEEWCGKGHGMLRLVTYRESMKS